MPSNITFDLLQNLSSDNWDDQLLYFVKYRFPLDFPHEEEGNLMSTKESHTYAEKYPEHMQTYLDTEIKHKAIYGPYKHKPYAEANHFLLFMSPQKSDSSNRGIIIDLCWPKQTSINHFMRPNVYFNTVYKIQYPTINNITNYLLQLGDGAKLYKTDKSPVFCQLAIEYNLFMLKWWDADYTDTSCPFSHRFGVLVCTHITDFFHYIMWHRGNVIFIYVDNWMQRFIRN